MMRLAAACILFITNSVCAEAPYIDPADDDQHFGPPEEELFWTLEQKVSGYRNMDKITWTRIVPAGDNPYPLSRAEVDLGDVMIVADDEAMSVSTTAIIRPRFATAISRASMNQLQITCRD